MTTSGRPRALAGLFAIALAVALFGALAGCAEGGRQMADAGNDENFAPPVTDAYPGDPYEDINRATLDRNLAVYDGVIEPVVRAYRWAVPEFVRIGLSNVLDNLATPRIFINDMLQGEFARASASFGRLAVNTTLGLGGLFDPASEMGIEKHDEDFGQTLAVYGVEGDPYLVLPLFGPSNPRDAVGRVVDMALDPANYLLFPVSLAVNMTASTVDRFARDPERIEALRRDSFDFYATLRDAYSQNRAYLVRNGAPEEEDPLEEWLSDDFDEDTLEPAARPAPADNALGRSNFPMLMP